MHERFNERCVVFIKKLLDKAISHFVCGSACLPVLNSFKSVKIKDSTSFALPDSMADVYPGNGGGSGQSGMSIQFEFDVKNRDITELSIQPKTKNDYSNAKDTLCNIKENELVIRDLGYISIDLLRKIHQKNAFFLNRIKPRTALYKKKDNKFVRVSLSSISRYLRKTGKQYIELELFIGDRKYFPCRVIFILIPDDKVKERKKRQLRKSQRRASKVDNEVLNSLDLNIFITNTSTKQVPTHEVYEIYKLRWQIELIFKSWKQLCEINMLKSVKVCRAEIIIYAQLLWIIVNWDIFNTLLSHLYGLENNILSVYKTFKTLKLLKPKFKLLIHNKKRFKEFIEMISITVSKNHFVERRNRIISSTQIINNLVK